MFKRRKNLCEKFQTVPRVVALGAHGRQVGLELVTKINPSTSTQRSYAGTGACRGSRENETILSPAADGGEDEPDRLSTP